MSVDLSAAERRLLVSEIHEALRQECPDAFEKSLPSKLGGIADLEKHIDEFLPIVRRSTATRIEPYLAQILDDICTKCPYQQHSGFCPLRYEQKCVLYDCAGPIIAAMRRALREIDVGRALTARREIP